MPERIQLKRSKGWKMPANTVKVDRSTKWGNPYRLYSDGYQMSSQVAVELFRRLLNEQGGFVAKNDIYTTVDDIKRELKGKNLACWCKIDQICHADVLLNIANEGA